MITSTKTIQQLTILNAQRKPGLGELDPIHVLVDDTSPTSGRITLACYGRAWTAYWGSMGADLTSFFCACDPGYICDNLVRSMAPMLQRNRKNDDAYLIDIIKAVQQALREQAVLAEEVAA